jgi:hypothetical protein
MTLGTEASYYKPSERELAETWRKYENALRLDVEEVTPPAKIMELESKVKLMSEQIEALQEAIRGLRGADQPPKAEAD